MTGTSSPPTAITTEGHESEQETFSGNSDNGNNNNGVACGAHAATMPRTGTGHVTELCQDRDDA